MFGWSVKAGIVLRAETGRRRGIGGGCARQRWFFKPLRRKTAVVATTGGAVSSGSCGSSGIRRVTISPCSKRNCSSHNDLRSISGENLKTRSNTSRLSPPPQSHKATYMAHNDTCILYKSPAPPTAPFRATGPRAAGCESACELYPQMASRPRRWPACRRVPSSFVFAHRLFGYRTRRFSLPSCQVAAMVEQLL
jgi:hypothetical protein